MNVFTESLQGKVAVQREMVQVMYHWTTLAKAHLQAPPHPCPLQDVALTQINVRTFAMYTFNCRGCSWFHPINAVDGAICGANLAQNISGFCK